MAVTYPIAVIGDWESVMGFRALGLDTYPVTSVEEAKKCVHELAKTWRRIWRMCCPVIRTNCVLPSS